MYARELFTTFGFDSVTVNPYLGSDSLEPFLEYSERGIFVLCRTSNAGSSDFQSLECSDGKSTGPLYLMVGQKAREWNRTGNVGLVAAATFPEDLRRVRSLCPDMPLLIPGIGTQGGDLAAAVRYGVDTNGEKAIIVSSRQIIYASRGRDFAEAARGAATRLKKQINDLLQSRSTS
jgi:orotidine-5'-phosphate decarboxylase